MSSAEKVELREYLEMRLGNVGERVGDRLNAMDKALELQAVELSRRLDILNHAHERAVEARRETVPRETFENYVSNNEVRVQETSKALEDKTSLIAQELARATSMLTAEVNDRVPRLTWDKWIEQQEEDKKLALRDREASRRATTLALVSAALTVMSMVVWVVLAVALK